MRIINGKKFYKRDENAAINLKVSGWDSYDGSNWQWYSLYYDPRSGLVHLDARNSGDCYGDYGDYWFDSPAAFAAAYPAVDVEKLLGDVDETSEALMDFVSKIHNK